MLYFRHVVLPADIAKLLPKNRLLSEVRYLRLCFNFEVPMLLIVIQQGYI